MLTRRIKVQITAFVVISLLVTAYLGTHYAGINFTGSGYDVSISLPDAGGSFKNGEVTYRGVPVGRIKQLKANDSGAVAVVHIDGGAPPIPAAVTVSVKDRSAIGEQFIDFSGTSTKGRKLADGDHLKGTTSSLPPDMSEIIKSGSDFVGSVPQDSLNTVIDEAYDASRDAGPDVGRLVKTSSEFSQIADRSFLVTSGLIDSSGRVLRTQQLSATSIETYSRSLNLLAKTLSTSDGDLRRLIGDAPAAAQQVGQLFNDVGVPLGVLMTNLVSTAQVFGTNAAGVEDAMIRMPEAMSVGYAITGSNTASFGLAQTYFDPLPCTKGYGGTSVRDGLSTSPGKAFNTSAGCTAAPGSGSDVRGPQAVLRGKASGARTTSKVRVDQVTRMSDLYGDAR